MNGKRDKKRSSVENLEVQGGESMNIQSVIDLITSKGKTKEMIEAFVSVYPKMSSGLREDLCHELECLAYTYSADEAKQIVLKMSPYGEHWSMDKIKAFIASRGISDKQQIHYYLVMNMMYNDYIQTAEMFGQKDNPDFYFMLAKNFIEDADGVDFKVEKYFKM